MIIRIATQEDIKNIATLYVQNHKSTYKGILSDEYINSLNVENAKEKWQKYLQNEKKRIWVACDEEEFLGFVASMPDETDENIWYLDSLHICEKARGKGVGTALIKTVGRYANENGYKKMSICVVKGNDNAESLYLKLGARPLKDFEERLNNTTVNSRKLLWDDVSEM